MKELDLPKRARTSLYIAFTAIGVFAGLAGRELIEEAAPLPTPIEEPAPAATSGVIWEATIAADVHNALFPTATPEASPIPTETPTPDPLADIDFCGTTTADGAVCRAPYPPPPTVTPYPTCGPDMYGGQLCVYRREEVK